jgi:hypothetical protein
MSAYSTIVVGTDGSKSSMLAVERAAKIAAAFDATLVIGCAYYKTKEDASKPLRQDSVTVLGTAPAQKTPQQPPRPPRQSDCDVMIVHTVN